MVDVFVTTLAMAPLFVPIIFSPIIALLLTSEDVVNWSLSKTGSNSSKDSYTQITLETSG